MPITREGAHSRPRILFHEDVTGKEITSKLLAQVKKLENVKMYEYTEMTDVIIEDDKCVGIKAKNEKGTYEIYAENTILQVAVSAEPISIPRIFHI